MMGRIGTWGLVLVATLFATGCDADGSAAQGFREVADADAVACDPALAEDVDDAVAATPEAEWVEGSEAGQVLYEGSCLSCDVLKAYLIQLAADIARAELEGRDASALRRRYDALFIVYRRHC